MSEHRKNNKEQFVFRQIILSFNADQSWRMNYKYLPYYYADATQLLDYIIT